MDFTLNTYDKLIQAVLATDHATQTVQQFFHSGCNDRDKKIILRHDVDRRPKLALAMARRENQRGIQATYYFRHMPNTFKPHIIEEIANLGHEIGYHYETLAKAAGNYKKAFAIFERELNDFRKIADITTICMHGRPLSKWDNRDLWQQYDFSSLGIIGEPYLSINYENILYLTDTGRSWDGGKYNLRDKVQQAATLSKPMRSTRDIIHYLNSNDKTIMLQSHPERWADSLPSLMTSYGADMATNLVKATLKRLRRA